DPDGKILAHDDDGGGKLNAKLQMTAPRDGVYRVYAAALKNLGSVVLTVSEANLVRQGFPAAKADPGDLTKSDTAWEVHWELTNPDNSTFGKATRPSSVLAIVSARFGFKD